MSDLIKIAIIGGGPAGVSLCLQLMRTLSTLKSIPQIEIVLFEKNKTLGHGLPYSLKEPSFCINLPKDYMALIPGEQGHFSDWLARHYKIKEQPFPPRYYFGQYTEQQLISIPHNPKLQLKTYAQHEVLNIRLVTNNTYQIHTQHNNNEFLFAANYIILALGHLPSTLFPFVHQPGNPWDMNYYDNISPFASVGIIGTRLTAIDVVLKLKQQKHQGPIVMMSRTGLLSSVRGAPTLPELHYLTPSNITQLMRKSDNKTILDALIHLLEQELKPYLNYSSTLLKYLLTIQTIPPLERMRYELYAARTRSTPWQSILSCFYQIIYKLWPQLDVLQREYFLKTYGSFLFTFLCSFPYEKGLILYSLMKKNQLTLYKELINVAQKERYFEAQFSNGPTLKVDHLFLATGAGTEPEHIPLLANMIQNQFIEKHPLGGININSTTYQVSTKNKQINPRIYALGDVVKGVCFKTIELGQIVTQAQIITQNIINSFIFN